MSVLAKNTSPIARATGKTVLTDVAWINARAAWILLNEGRPTRSLLVQEILQRRAKRNNEHPTDDGAHATDERQDGADREKCLVLLEGNRVGELLPGLTAVVGVDRAGDLGDGEVALPVVVATFGGVIVLIPRIDVIVLDALDVAPEVFLGVPAIAAGFVAQAVDPSATQGPLTLGSLDPNDARGTGPRGRDDQVVTHAKTTRQEVPPRSRGLDALVGVELCDQLRRGLELARDDVDVVFRRNLVTADDRVLACHDHFFLLSL